MGLLSLWDLLWDSSGIHATCVGPHVTRDTHVGLAARGWLDCLVFSWVFNLACSSTTVKRITFQDSFQTAFGALTSSCVWLSYTDSVVLQELVRTKALKWNATAYSLVFLLIYAITGAAIALKGNGDEGTAN